MQKKGAEVEAEVTSETERDVNGKIRSVDSNVMARRRLCQASFEQQNTFDKASNIAGQCCNADIEVKALSSVISTRSYFEGLCIEQNERPIERTQTL